MKKTFILFLILTKSVLIFSQDTEISGKIEYITSLSLGLPVSSTSTMYFSSTNSKFIQGIYESEQRDPEMKIIEMESGTDSDIIFADLKKNELVTKTSLGDESFLVKEVLSTKWVLSSETREILDYTCSKATGQFRGRHYTLWYTIEVPIKAGPWKLNNLPGLILEANDDSGSVRFLATKIHIANSEKKDEEFYQYYSDEGSIIELKNFVKRKREYEKEEIKKIMSKFPKEMKVSGFTESDKISNLEVSYEWEN